jgi:hypothetical protein
MIVKLMDRATGAPVYINPAYVVTLRPDPADPDEASIITIRDGESVRVKGDHESIARQIRGAAAA